jgi:diaminopimelate decarboxylase
VTHTLICSKTARHDAAVDGGMSDNMRLRLYDSGHAAMLADEATAGPDVVVTVASEHCESGDVFVCDGVARDTVARVTWEDVLRLRRPLHQ